MACIFGLVLWQCNCLELERKLFCGDYQFLEKSDLQTMFYSSLLSYDFLLLSKYLPIVLYLFSLLISFHYYNVDKIAVVLCYHNSACKLRGLDNVGLRGERIYFGKSKIQKIINDHEEMNETIIKKIPNMIENPILIMQSITQLNSIVVIGELCARNGEVVIAAIKVETRKQSGKILDFAVITSAYGKGGLQHLIDNSNVLYIEPNKKRTNNWLKALRVQFPSALTSFGSIDRISYFNNEGKSNFEKSTAIADAFEKASCKSTVGDFHDATAMWGYNGF